MKRPSQLVRLILDFYRENPTELEQLQSLENAQVFRRWGVWYIRVYDLQKAEALLDIRSLLEDPILQLRLARKIKILVGRDLFARFAVGSDEPITRSTQPLSRDW
ncbi:hypothetical protein IQ235_09820 [Oscillatoriales cyanobacterium LEGE 11467]|uniref:Uncharacterized protein n=1 Tax=Zarconia navalis LEGE 11467 TaxID=1828826 RepID=A0A928W0K0_9CYAN|nr:hypothetical protein [Zarconia navalis]MBE9041075.1 hypothetical protein [Zarconia navalis LEGE 11467]